MTGNRDLFLDRTRLSSFSLQLNHCGIQQGAPEYGYGFQMRLYHLIHFVLEGTGSLKIHD